MTSQINTDDNNTDEKICGKINTDDVMAVIGINTDDEKTMITNNEAKYLPTPHYLLQAVNPIEKLEISLKISKFCYCNLSIRIT